MIKVAIIGAGSVVFSKNLTGDILSFPEFRNATFSYMDIDPERLEVGAALCRRLARSVGASPEIQATLDRRQALDGADFVINMVQVGGFDSTLVDFEIPRKYGLNFTIADTTGPGGFFRGLRTYPMLKGLCADMMQLCPAATLLNYSNPMSMNMQTIFRTSNIRAVGLCHSVQGTFQDLMGYLKENHEECAFLCAGINHMAFFIRLEKAGQDLYPRLFAAMKDPNLYKSNAVRFELMKRLGYFVTESSEHNAEYGPWFIPHGPEQIARFNVPLDEYLRRCDDIVEKFEQLKTQSLSQTQDQPMEIRKSHEYGSNIIHSLVTGQPRVVYGNMPNRGCISNLPTSAIAEAPTVVDRTGMSFVQVGELPPQLIAYMNPHVQQQELFIRAAMEGRRDHVYQAAMFDPLTAATLTMDQIVQMCDELIAAHGFEKDGGCLPDLDGKKTLVPGSGMKFPPANPQDLRASWNATYAKRYRDNLIDWYVIGPFPSAKPGEISLEEQTPLDRDFLRQGDGSLDLLATYSVGQDTLRWKKIQADSRGYVNCDEHFGRHLWCFVYGYAEVHSVHPRDTVLTCGSDDGIQTWVNGQEVHKNEINRGYTPASDSCPIHLNAGVNRILVKVDQYIHSWGFGVGIPKANH